MKLYEYRELNQSKLMSYCGLNHIKHRKIIDDMVEKEFITRTNESRNKTLETANAVYYLGYVLFITIRKINH